MLGQLEAPLVLLLLELGLERCWIISVFFPPSDEADQAGDRAC